MTHGYGSIPIGFIILWVKTHWFLKDTFLNMIQNPL